MSFRIGPNTPKIGALLKTTCSDDEDDFEATEVELDEEEAKRRRRNFMNTLRLRRNPARGKRQDEEDGGLADLGICFGDILPAVREQYPDKLIAIQVSTVRAPSIILSQAGGGEIGIGQHLKKTSVKYGKKLVTRRAETEESVH